MGVLGTSVICYGGEKDSVPVYGRDIKDGNYEVEVESSSSMFRVVKAKLQVDNGSMTAVLTLSGTGYLKLFMGTGQEALKADEESCIPYTEDGDGAYTYTIPVEALNVEFPCAAFSKRKETWYDRELVIWASSLPEDVMLAGTKESFRKASPWGRMKNGNYRIEVSLEGGTGRAGIVSPAHISVTEGTAVASIEWSSPDYDYMVVNEEKYLPVNSEGNSVFRIPVPAPDEEIPVIADTVAMSSPHEVEYKLTFHGDTMRREESGLGVIEVIAFGAAAALVGCGLEYKNKRKRRRDV